MKNFKRFTAAIAATLMAASLSIPMAMQTSAASITINGITASEAHTFEVYQVFTGELSTAEDGAKQLTDLKWGNGVSTYDGTEVTSGDFVSDDIISNLGTDARAIAKKIVTSDNIAKTATSENGTVTIDGLADGYYIVKDVSDFSNKDEANSSYIVQVAGTATIAIKNAKPTVDKQVWDEEADAETGANDGWGESADHAINESFQFKLTATIPADANLAAYETYKLVFHDTMSAGVTFEKIESVKVNGTVITAENYTSTATTDAGIDWTLTIDDVKSIVNANNADVFGKSEFTVEVIYNAHLNENAVVDKASQTDGTPENTNNNNVYLEYSNNPDHFGDGDGTGETTKDYVWVFTYEVDNTKYKIESKDGNELAGAKFSLHTDSKDGAVIAMTWNAEKSAYMPTANGGTSEDMVSKADGTFNIMGLDAGTYYLVEDEAPTGFNKADPIEIKIGATHSETDAESEKVTMTLTSTQGMNNEIVDTKTSSLPETGGIGTKLFYIGGGCMVGLAGVLLITKKRAKNAQN